VFYIVPDHIKFTAEMEMIRNVGELLSNSTNRSYASTRLQVYSFKRLLWYLLRNEAITEKISISKVGIAMLLKSILEEHSDELLLFKNEARHKGFLEQLSKVMNEFQSGGIEIEDFSSFFEATNPTENEKRLKEFGIIYRYYTNALKQDFVHQEESYAQLCSVIASKDLSNTFIAIDEMVTLSKAEMEVIEALVGSGATVEFHATLTTYGVHTAKNEIGDSLFTSNRILLERLSRWINRGDDLARIIEWENTESIFDEEFNIARVGDEQVLRTDAGEDHQVYREREHVVHRQRGYHQFSLDGEVGLNPLFGLQHIGADIAVREDGAFGYAGGTAGVLQEGGVFQRNRHGMEGVRRALLERVVEAHEMGQFIRRHHFFHMAHNQVHQAAFEEAEQIAHRGEDDVFHIGFGHHFGQRVGKVFQHQDGGGAAVFQLVLQFARGVERVDVHHDAAGL